MNLLDDIAAGLADLRAATGFTVTYERDNVTEEVTATIGSTLSDQVISDEGATVRGITRDYLIAAAVLLLNGSPVQPQAGDIITEADGTVFEVRPLGSEPCWRWSDQATRQHYRIHTQQVTNL